MLLQHKASQRLAASRLAYVCPQCQFKQFSSTFTQEHITPASSTKPQRSSRRFQFSSHYETRSSFHTSSNSRALDQATISTDQTPNFSFFRRPRKPPRSQPSFIRNELKEWSKREEEKAKQDAATTAPSHATQLAPHALFLDAAPNNNVQDQELEENEPLSDPDDFTEGFGRIGFEPGDLVYTRFRTQRRNFAVYLGLAGVQQQYLLPDGRWLIEATVPGYGERVPNFISEEERLQILKYVPSEPQETKGHLAEMTYSITSVGDTPPEVAGPILARITKIKQEITDFHRQHLPTLDSVYDRLAHESDYVTTDILALPEQLLGVHAKDLSDASKLGLFLAVDNEAPRIQVCRETVSQRLTLVITPKTLVKQFEQVIQWTREYQECAAAASVGNTTTVNLEDNPLSLFIDKTRRLILKSRRIRSPTTIGSLGPSKIHSASPTVIDLLPSGEVFSEPDKMIIEFLWDVNLRRPQPFFKSIYHSISSLILRAVGAYPNTKLEAQVGKLFLQEIGCMAPWHEPGNETVAFPLPGRRGGQAIQALAEEALFVSNQLQFDTDRGPSALTDTMADLRQDMGSMEVLCIDGGSTVIVDDGVSLEQCKESHDQYWIHVHVSNPSAFIPKDHIFAKQAAMQGCNLYTIKDLYTMMPHDVCRSLSLRANAATVTISTLLDEHGKVHDIRMRPSRVQSVVRLTPEAVARVLGESEDEIADMIVGSNREHISKVKNELTDAQLREAQKYTATLQKLSQLAQARHTARTTEVTPFPAIWRKHPTIDVQVSYLESYNPRRLQESYHYQGDPTIKVSGIRFANHSSVNEANLERSITAALMQIANESAAKWFMDRKIPVFFVGALPQSGFPLSKLANLGPDERYLGPVSIMSSVPHPHVLMNMKQYCRMTSPLRRYTDLVASWQFDAFYRLHGEDNITAQSTNGHGSLPFSAADIDEWCLYKNETLTMAEKSRGPTSMHWAFQAFFRAFHFKEAPLPDVWDMAVVKVGALKLADDDTHLRGKLLPFSLSTIVLSSGQGWEDKATMQAILPVKIELVDPVKQVVWVRPVGPVSATHTQTGPIHIRRET